ncbi:MAG: sigma-54-dependent Fis family transcriptional regulator, partial [Myxococcales bacterium]|nr:sigma-54-dependent Fis family transcriptional regulator [Myxococcales bacterium]
VAAGEFRDDLYFRLNVVPLTLPPLRERPDDIPLLCCHYVDVACRENGMASKPIEPEAMAALVAYSWPGNVRELRNVMERMAILSEGALTLADVPAELLEERDGDGDGDLALAGVLGELGDEQSLKDLSLKSLREAVERAFIRQRLTDFGWNVSRTAEALGVERTHLHRKMKLLGITRGGV